MPFLLRLFGLQHCTRAERRAAAWIAVMFFCGLAATFLLRPLRDQFGLKAGVDNSPRLYTWTLCATVVAVLPFWWLANRMPSRRFVPIVLHLCTALVVALAVGLGEVGEYDWKQLPWLGEWFWGGYSALNVVVPSLVWIHAVEHFRSEQARRMFALIAVGGTLGAVVGSWLAGWLCRAAKDGGLALAPWVAAVVAAVLLQATFASFRASQTACRELGGEAKERVASGGVLEGVRVLVHSPRARAIGVYMMLLGMLATAFWVAQTDLIGNQKSDSRAQHGLLADVEFWKQSLILTLQLACTGRLMQRWPAAALLVSLPIVSIVGLGALWLAPAVLTINLVIIARGGAQYAFEKPAREVLYTPLPLATKHKVKFLLDTFAFRLGDLGGAWLQVGLRDAELGLRGSVVATVLIALAWIALGLVLGRARPEPLAEASASASASEATPGIAASGPAGTGRQPARDPAR